MKATELRIGNIVATAPIGGGIRIPNYKYPFVIHSIGMQCECFNLGDNPATQAELPDFHITDLVGIPLTEEWILKFGFEKVSHVSYRKVNNDLDFQIILSATGNGYNTASAITKRPIRTVHDLQNLYYALSGEDLSTSVGTK